eukprot:scaffold88859_cov18-Tisochrysis_lutea.AAC.2
MVALCVQGRFFSLEHGEGNNVVLGSRKEYKAQKESLPTSGVVGIGGNSLQRRVFYISEMRPW